jgi:mRNA interferase YafQ
MLTPVRSAQFRRDVKRAERRGKDMAKLRQLLLLLTRQSLSATYRDHPLHGKWMGFRDAHIGPDWLLVYRVVGDELQLAAYAAIGFVETFRTPATGAPIHVEMRLDGFSIGVATRATAADDHGQKPGSDAPPGEGRDIEIVLWCRGYRRRHRPPRPLRWPRRCARAPAQSDATGRKAASDWISRCANKRTSCTAEALV